MRKTKMQKGITLIALIITIVILLILAIVTIGSIKNSNIVTYAQNAANDYEKERGKEESILAGYESLIIESNMPVENDSSRIGKAEVGKIVDKNSTINGKSYNHNNPIIPVGFAPINIKTEGQESLWDAEGGPEVENGLVIQDKAGNEFVWVPVKEDINANGYGLNTGAYREPDVVTGVTPSETVDSASGNEYDAVLSNLQRAGCTEDLNNDGKVSSYDFKIQLINEYKAMVESVNEYNGFYVGRFETSEEGEKPQSKASTEEKVIETAYNSSKENDWYGLYALNKKYKTSSVQGSMIWGIQYDKMMIWMEDAANDTIEDKRNKQRTCGTAPDDVINNVYDLYGNSLEWTLEAGNTFGRAFRGGYFYESGWPRNHSTGAPSDINNCRGSRLTLYIV